jgi:hypothetical protein
VGKGDEEGGGGGGFDVEFFGDAVGGLLAFDPDTGGEVWSVSAGRRNRAETCVLCTEMATTIGVNFTGDTISRLKLLFRCTAAVGMFLSAWAGAQNKPDNPAISPLSSEMKAAMTGKSWKPGCPVALDDLASVRVTYIDFDGHTQEGNIVVHKRIADDTSKIFQELYSFRFPIHKVAPWENYGADVYAQQNIT